MTTRRNFIKKISAAGIACSIPSVLYSRKKSGKDMIWANLLHLSFNMWNDNVPIKYKDDDYQCKSCQEALDWALGNRPNLSFDYTVWDVLLKDLAASGMNMLIIDLGDGVQYESHPEIAVRNAWTIEKLRSELKKIRNLGIEPIPKLNFSTTHDIWLGKYSRMVSTDIYYAVCRDLISEVIDLFDKPRFFHLGMDEEGMKQNQDIAIARQNDLWWGDLYFLIGEVEKKGVRSWIWSDYSWEHPDIFFKKMPKSVLQSNWYYDSGFDLNGELSDYSRTAIKMYHELEKQGYDQVPTGSNHDNDRNMEATVEYCKKIIDPSRLLGFMTAPWRPTHAACLERHREAIAQVGRAIRKFY